jgi:hypothetical protein
MIGSHPIPLAALFFASSCPIESENNGEVMEKHFLLLPKNGLTDFAALF